MCQLAGRHLRSNRDADQLPDRWLQLTAGSQSQLTQVADKLKACPNAKVAVVGHTDNTGNDAINIPLSGNRAKSVADYLISQGVPAGSINLSGVGSAQPIASGSLSYNETIAEVWFRDVETAEKAGFARWDSGKSQRGEN